MACPTPISHPLLYTTHTHTPPTPLPCFCPGIFLLPPHHNNSVSHRVPVDVCVVGVCTRTCGVVCWVCVSAYVRVCANVCVCTDVCVVPVQHVHPRPEGRVLVRGPRNRASHPHVPPGERRSQLQHVPGGAGDPPDPSPPAGVTPPPQPS